MKSRYAESSFDADDEGMASPRVSVSHNHESLGLEVLADVHINNDSSPSSPAMTSFIKHTNASPTCSSATSPKATHSSHITSPLSHTVSSSSSMTSQPTTQQHDHPIAKSKRPVLKRVTSIDLEEPPDEVTGQTMRKTTYDTGQDNSDRLSIQQNSRTTKNELFSTGLQESNRFLQFSDKEVSGNIDVQDDSV